MAQNLLRISPEALQLQMHAIPFSTLKSMHEEIFQYLRRYGEMIGDQEQFDLQRKASKIERELVRRAGKPGPDFNAWAKRHYTKLKR